MMNIHSFRFNPFQMNTFLLSTDDGKALLIDPGCYGSTEEEQLRDYLSQNDLTLERVVNTHLHLDHTFGNTFVEETWGVAAWAHAGDAFWLESMENQCRLFGLPMLRPIRPIGRYLEEGEEVTLGNESFQVLHVPGHSPGSIVLYNAGAGVLFAGDVLFQGSIGRTDLQGGDYATLIKGIQTKLLTLPDETVVFCGHGPSTTIGSEKKSNPFL